VSAQIRTATDTDIRKELFYRLSASDMPIMQLRKDEKSLEDVFLELTGDDATDSNNEESVTEDNEAEKSDEEVTDNDGNI
jgi:ABC-2 type transport system ATP-binding protein